MITLYTADTGNGHRAAILLEEMELPYRTHRVDFAAGEHRGTAFRAVNPLGKIPVIVDDDGPSGAPITVAESLAIALYLVEKTGRLAPATPEGRAMAWTWGSAVVTNVGANFTGIFHARMAGEAAHAPYIAARFADLEGQFAMLDTHLAGRAYIAGDAYTWVDALAFPLVGTAGRFGIDVTGLPSLGRWSAAVSARPAVRRALAPLAA